MIDPACRVMVRYPVTLACVFLLASATLGFAAAAKQAHATALKMNATAYCRDGETTSGMRTRAGIVAADPRILPIGSVIRILEPRQWAGTYTVGDTGSRVKGRELDIFVRNCREAKRFGRRVIQVVVLRRGR